MKHQSLMNPVQSKWDEQEFGRSQTAKGERRKIPLHWYLKALTRWTVALKSFALVIACKNKQTRHAMRFLLETEGNSFERSFAAFRATAAGLDLLQSRPNLRSLYSNRALFHACPTGSLGYWYAEFMNVYGLDEGHYLGLAIEQGAQFADDPARAWFHTRMDGSHDVRHVLAGYGPDLLGEICLLSFRFGQIRHFGILTLIFLGVLNLTFATRGPVFRPLREAYLRGRRAELLDLLPWESSLAQPLSAHRAALGLTPPKQYPLSFAPDAYMDSEDSWRHKQSNNRLVGGTV